MDEGRRRARSVAGQRYQAKDRRTRGAWPTSAGAQRGAFCNLSSTRICVRAVRAERDSALPARRRPRHRGSADRISRCARRQRAWQAVMATRPPRASRARDACLFSPASGSGSRRSRIWSEGRRAGYHTSCSTATRAQGLNKDLGFTDKTASRTSAASPSVEADGRRRSCRWCLHLAFRSERRWRASMMIASSSSRCTRHADEEANACREGLYARRAGAESALHRHRPPYRPEHPR